MNLDGTFNEKVIPCLEFTMDFNPINSFIKKNTLNDNRSFMFLYTIFMIGRGGLKERYQSG